MHIDIWGSDHISYHSGSNYYATFIEDATRRTWVYYFKKKFDVFYNFKKWKYLVENEIGKNLKCLRSYNGGQYCSNDYYSNHGIRREKTVPRTP